MDNPVLVGGSCDVGHELGAAVNATELRKLASTKRDSAARARRLAKMLKVLADRDELLQRAATLESEARDLELEAQSHS